MINFSILKIKFKLQFKINIFKKTDLFLKFSYEIYIKNIPIETLL